MTLQGTMRAKSMSDGFGRAAGRGGRHGAGWLMLSAIGSLACATAALIVVLLLITSGGSAPSAAVDVQGGTDDGVALDEPILVRVKGVLLRIPAGYLRPLPSHKLRNRVNEAQELRFDFALPDARYPAQPSAGNGRDRPQGNGRGEPPREPHVVNVRDLQPVRLDQPGYLSPEQQLQDLAGTFGIAESRQEEFGLVRFWWADEPRNSSLPLANYRHAQGSDPQVLMQCSASPRTLPTAPFPGCHGSVHVAADDLAFFVDFPPDELPHWRDAVAAVRALVGAWRVER